MQHLQGAASLPIMLLGIAVLTGPAAAEIPQVISYQGKVTDGSGVPIPDGVYTAQFRLYDAASGGTLEWDSGIVSVEVSGGTLGVLLGESPQPGMDLAFDEDYWLEVEISSDIQLPRVKIGSIGYVYMASGLAPGTEVSGSVPSGTHAALKGVNTATDGVLYGVAGSIASNYGAGVLGEARAVSGIYTCGVRGRSTSIAGRGVRGTAVATEGLNYGVYGETLSSEGYGVYGKNLEGWAGGFDGDVDLNGGLVLPDNDATPSVGSGAIQIGDASRALKIDGNEILTNTNELLHLQRDNNGDLQVDNGTPYVDASENRLGLGVSSPGYALQVGTACDGTEARANAWNLLSSRDYTTDIPPPDGPNTSGF